MIKFPHQKGITVVEILVVIAIMSIILRIVLPQFSKSKENQVLKNGAEDVVAVLDKARSQTLASFNSSEYGVHFQSDKVIIFKGKVFSSGASDNENISIVTPATISNVTLGGVSGTTGDMYFNRLYGAPSTTGTITVSTSSYSKTVTISATGTASMN